MKLVVGLGNPGRKFAKTRHNTGHLFITYVAKKKEIKTLPAKFLKTSVFMNDSGKEIKKLTITHNLSPNNLLVTHDDMDLPLSKLKLQFGRSAAGHKGVQSIIDALGTKDFWRLRLGIGAPPEEVTGEDYVLEKFSREGLKILKNALEEAYPRVLEWVSSS